MAINWGYLYALAHWIRNIVIETIFTTLNPLFFKRLKSNSFVGDLLEWGKGGQYFYAISFEIVGNCKKHQFVNQWGIPEELFFSIPEFALFSASNCKYYCPSCQSITGDYCFIQGETLKVGIFDQLMYTRIMPLFCRLVFLIQKLLIDNTKSIIWYSFFLINFKAFIQHF